MTVIASRPAPAGEHLGARAVAPAAALVSLVLVSLVLGPAVGAGQASPPVGPDRGGVHAGVEQP